MKGKKQSISQKIARLSDDPAARRQVFKDLLKHLSDGFSIDSFPPLSVVTIKEFTKIYPNEFIWDDIENALRGGKDMWERIGRSQARGECLGNSRTWYYNMANRYGWREKIDIEAEHKGAVNVNVVSYASLKARDANHDKD